MKDIITDAIRAAEIEVPDYPWNIMNSYQAVHVPNLGWIDTLECNNVEPDIYGQGLAETTFRFRIRGFDGLYEAVVENNSWDGYTSWEIFEIEEYSETVKKYRRKK